MPKLNVLSELQKKAYISSPCLTDIPTAPTPEAGTKTNQIATAEFVSNGFLSTAGDTMHGALVMDGNYADIVASSTKQDVTIFGGQSTATGSYLNLHGCDEGGANANGNFQLTANNGLKNCTLYGYANGDLSWGGKFLPNQVVINNANDVQETAYNNPALTTGNPSGLHIEMDNNEIMAKASASTLSPIYLYGSSVDIGARVADSSKSYVVLACRNDGTLKWNGKEVERVNAYVANSYIRYESGLQICYMTSGVTSNAHVKINFPIAFSDVPKATVSRAINETTNEAGHFGVSTTKTYINVYSSGTAYTVHIIAIGRWK